MERRRRTTIEIEGDREARSIAIGLGRVVRETRRRLRLTQSALAGAVGLRRSRISEIERGLATGTPLIVWARLGMELGRPLAMAFSRDLAAPLPTDAGHLAGQELVLRLARQTGRTGLFELATRPLDPRHSVDACFRDDPNRTLILNEIWNRFDDLGRAARSTDRKVAEAEEIAIGLGGDRPYRVAACWLLVDTAANRALVARYPEVLRARFPGSSRAGVRALTEGGPVPREPGIAWIDLRSNRLVPMRHRRTPGHR
ncbi:MAG TPA: helix-turn-helix domain-containing protein [Clostridia bacterium]|nr:helix-turn-helix domain-containing protein [Clostridia bacterium]